MHESLVSTALSRRAMLRAAAGAALTGCVSRSGSRARDAQPTRPPPSAASTSSGSTESASSTEPPSTEPPLTSPVWPVPGWRSVTPEAAGWDAVGLEAALDFAMERNSESVVVLSGGQVVAERHARGNRYRRDVASVQKSVVSLLVGRAVDLGALSLDDTVGSIIGTNWTNDAVESSITVRHLLSMTSGLDDRLRVARPPGSAWYYNTNAFLQLHRVLEAVMGMKIAEIAAAWLWGPISAPDTGFERRRASDPKGRAIEGVVTTARDLARVGLLVQRAGYWMGEPVCPDRYLQTALSPSSPANPSYGYLWWLNGRDGYRLPGNDPQLTDGPLIPSAPSDMVAALGHADQKLYVAPSLDLVITRLGGRAEATRAALSGFDDAWWRQLMAARR